MMPLPSMPPRVRIAVRGESSRHFAFTSLLLHKPGLDGGGRVVPVGSAHRARVSISTISMRRRIFEDAVLRAEQAREPLFARTRPAPARLRLVVSAIARRYRPDRSDLPPRQFGVFGSLGAGAERPPMARCPPRPRPIPKRGRRICRTVRFREMSALPGPAIASTSRDEALAKRWDRSVELTGVDPTSARLLDLDPQTDPSRYTCRRVARKTWGLNSRGLLRSARAARGLRHRSSLGVDLRGWITLWITTKDRDNRYGVLETTRPGKARQKLSAWNRRLSAYWTNPRWRLRGAAARTARCERRSRRRSAL